MTTPVTPSNPLRRAVALLLLAGGVLGLLLAGAGPAAAHAKVRGTVPAEGSVVRSAPVEITMRFTKEMTLLDDSIKVIDPDGRRVDTGTTGHVGSDRTTARVAVEGGLRDGTYTVSWKAVSADSHPIGEAYVFSVGAPSPTKAVVPDTEPGGGLAGDLYSGARFVAYLGYVLTIGTAAFLLLCRPGTTTPRRLRLLLAAGWTTLLASGLTLLALRAPYTTGSGLGQALDPTALRTTLDTDAGSALLVRLLLLGGAGMFLVVIAGSGDRAGQADDRAVDDDGVVNGEPAAGPVRAAPAYQRPALIIAGTLIAAALAYTWAVTGHSAAGPQTSLALPVGILHLMAVAVWLGGLTALVALSFRAREEVPAAAVARFSRLALGAVAVLAVTGLYQSWRLVGSWDALFSSRFGTLLLVKTGAVATVLAVAAYSRRWTARLDEPAAGHERPGANGPSGEAGREAGEPVAVASGPAAESVRSRESSEETAPAGDVRTEVEEPALVTALVSAGPAESAEPAESARPVNHSGPAEPAQPPQPAAAANSPEPARSTEFSEPVEPSSPTGLTRPSGPAGFPDPPATGTPPLPGPSARRRLRRSVAAEALLALAVLGVTTALTETTPARTGTNTASTAQAAPAGAQPDTLDVTIPFDTRAKNGSGKVVVTLSPGSVGRNEILALVYGVDDGYVAVPELRLTFTSPDGTIGPLDSGITDAGGYWRTGNLQLPTAGKWTMAVTVRLSDIDQATATKTVTIS